MNRVLRFFYFIEEMLERLFPAVEARYTPKDAMDVEKTNEIAPEQTKPMETVNTPSPAEILVQEAKKWLGQDVTPDDKVPDEVACVASLVKVVPPDFGIDPTLTYTPALFKALKLNKNFKAVLTPKAGSIIISPTEGDVRGHCGIMLTSKRIASNNSNNGLWENNYSLDNWVSYYRLRKGLHLYFFEPVTSTS